jgi:hypothetical protein
MIDRSLSSAEQSIVELLNGCTVKIQTGSGQGTGFFVAPGLIVTCHHVVRDNRVVTVTRGGKSTDVAVMDILRGRNWDLALLEFGSVDHPCVFLHNDIRLGDNVYTFGYTDQYPEGEPASFEFEGVSGGPSLLKLKGGQARPGLSGAPVLNLRTGGVCGVINSTFADFEAGGAPRVGALARPVPRRPGWCFRGSGTRTVRIALDRDGRVRAPVGRPSGDWPFDPGVRRVHHNDNGAV